MAAGCVKCSHTKRIFLFHCRTDRAPFNFPECLLENVGVGSSCGWARFGCDFRCNWLNSVGKLLLLRDRQTQVLKCSLEVFWLLFFHCLNLRNSLL